MIVDTSALIAILLNEPDRDAFVQALATAPTLRMSSSTHCEVFVVLANVTRHDSDAFDRRVQGVADLLDLYGIVIEPSTAGQVAHFRDAYHRFGRGSGHRAKLNFGDCFTYALAAETGEPILCKGEDFVQTDLPVVPL